MRVARLNQTGIALFTGWLETLKEGGLLQTPVSVLTDAQHTDPLDVDVEVEPRSFANRFEAAAYLYERFAGGAIKSVGQFWTIPDQYLPQSLLARVVLSWSMASALRSSHHAPAILSRFWSTCLWPLSTSPEPIGNSAARAAA